MKIIKYYFNQDTNKIDIITIEKRKNSIKVEETIKEEIKVEIFQDQNQGHFQILEEDQDHETIQIHRNQEIENIEIDHIQIVDRIDTETNTEIDKDPEVNHFQDHIQDQNTININQDRDQEKDNTKTITTIRNIKEKQITITTKLDQNHGQNQDHGHEPNQE